MKVFDFLLIYIGAAHAWKSPSVVAGSDIKTDQEDGQDFNLKYGTLVIPTNAKLLANNISSIQVHIRGRVSSPTTEQEVRNVIDATGKAAVVESQTEQVKNSKLRQAYFYTSAIANLPVTLEMKNKAFDFSLDNPKQVKSDVDGSFNFTGVVSRSDGGSFQHGDVVEYSVGGVAGYLTVSSGDGFSIVADVDDTIKDTGALWLPDLIANTFLRPFKVAPTMPELFSRLQNELPNADYYYLSGMPVQFLPAEEPFIEKHFPLGEFVLPFISKATGGIVKILDYKQFKVDQSVKIIQNFPQRKLILFGDSTQLDPEAYAEVYKLHPDSVQCIFIRVVEGYNRLSERSKNDPHRFIRSFLGIPHSKWMVFRNATELPSAEDIKKGQCRDPDWFPQ